MELISRQIVIKHVMLSLEERVSEMKSIPELGSWPEMERKVLEAARDRADHIICGIYYGKRKAK